jgi:N-acetylmuramic acid 6-phosphate etherase
MVNMQLSNDKLIERGTRMVADATGLDENRAKKLLLEAGSVKAAVDEYNNSDW